MLQRQCIIIYYEMKLKQTLKATSMAMSMSILETNINLMAKSFCKLQF